MTKPNPDSKPGLPGLALISHTPTKYQIGDRVRDREDGRAGRVYRVLSGAAVDYCTPIYEVLWDHEPGEVAMGSRHYADELESA
jgi:hypothetical protein